MILSSVEREFGSWRWTSLDKAFHYYDFMFCSREFGSWLWTSLDRAFHCHPSLILLKRNIRYQCAIISWGFYIQIPLHHDWGWFLTQSFYRLIMFCHPKMAEILLIRCWNATTSKIASLILSHRWSITDWILFIYIKTFIYGILFILNIRTDTCLALAISVDPDQTLREMVSDLCCLPLIQQFLDTRKNDLDEFVKLFGKVW